mmetsp:Transcript_101410/g.312805  ORF Transcript_101410/g.312805 Transcript_101410/m.312805 type:complete len:347 (+) Transcript_101410:471-1511(+)
MVVRRWSSHTWTVHVALSSRLGLLFMGGGRARRFKSVTKYSPVWVIEEAEDDWMRDCSKPQLFRKTHRPCFSTFTPLPSEGESSTRSCTRNLSPKGTSCETDEDCSVTETSLPAGAHERQYVVVTLVWRGHIGAGGTGNFMVTSRIFTVEAGVPGEAGLASPPASSIHGATHNSVALCIPKYSPSRELPCHPSAPNSPTNSLTCSHGMCTSNRLRKGSSAAKAASAADAADFFRMRDPGELWGDASLSSPPSSESSLSSSSMLPSPQPAFANSAAMAIDPASQPRRSTDITPWCFPRACSGCRNTRVATSRLPPFRISFTSSSGKVNCNDLVTIAMPRKQMCLSER